MGEQAHETLTRERSGHDLLDAISLIPAGRVKTYVDLTPGAPWVASHVVRVSRPAAVPWWRVVRADGSLAGGREQHERLEQEGVAFRPGARARVDLRISHDIR